MNADLVHIAMARRIGGFISMVKSSNGNGVEFNSITSTDRQHIMISRVDEDGNADRVKIKLPGMKMLEASRFHPCAHNGEELTEIIYKDEQGDYVAAELLAESVVDDFLKDDNQPLPRHSNCTRAKQGMAHAMASGRGHPDANYYRGSR